mmetsp:Transcript_93174/g.269114  ORF Transcript_93174/g.269114 Transcript_93174/m.269114 type:complete len:204 (+) Transcript_93174:218-829(+)
MPRRRHRETTRAPAYFLPKQPNAFFFGIAGISGAAGAPGIDIPFDASLAPDTVLSNLSTRSLADSMKVFTGLLICSTSRAPTLLCVPLKASINGCKDTPCNFSSMPRRSVSNWGACDIKTLCKAHNGAGKSKALRTASGALWRNFSKVSAPDRSTSMALSSKPFMPPIADSGPSRSPTANACFIGSVLMLATSSGLSLPSNSC